MDQLLRTDFDAAKDWAICGVGLMPADKTMAQNLQNQNGLYTLVSKHPDGHNTFAVAGSVREMLQRGEDTPLAAAMCAAWAVSLEGKAENGQAIPISDKAWEEMKLPLAAQMGGEKAAFLNVQSIFGELAENEAFLRDYLAAFEVIKEKGVRGLLEKLA